MKGLDLSQIDIESLGKVAVLGYGNQGRAQALNLRDSGVEVFVGLRDEGSLSADAARTDSFSVSTFNEAAARANTVMFLLPDTAIADVYQQVLEPLSKGKTVGFAHGFAYHFRLIEKLQACSYFLVAPKGAGALLRSRYLSGKGLPMAYAVEGAGARKIALSYAKAIGCSGDPLETSFFEETECDLFGEQSVLCGGMIELMNHAYEKLVEKGHRPEMAFFESCYEAKRILELLLAYGPKGMADRISPTALYGGYTRGKRLFGKSQIEELEKIYQEIQEGDFSLEWLREVEEGAPILMRAKQEISESALQRGYERTKPLFEGED